MQEFCEDFAMNEEGCCLNCPDAHPDCLCFNCMCKKCYWYLPPEENYKDDCEKGRCEYIEVLKQEKKEEFLKDIQNEKDKKYEKYELLRKQNEELEKKIKEKGGIVSVYSCQRCQHKIVLGCELKIVNGIFPICDVCNNKIEVKNGKEN